MKGVINRGVQELVLARFGQEAWDAIKAKKVWPPSQRSTPWPPTNGRPNRSSMICGPVKQGGETSDLGVVNWPAGKKTEGSPPTYTG
jgi:hypothetical protein